MKRSMRSRKGSKRLRNRSSCDFPAGMPPLIITPSLAADRSQQTRQQCPIIINRRLGMYGDTLLRSQFGKPSGLFGALFKGTIMNQSNAGRVNATGEVLDPKPKDAVWEIGFGGRLALVALAAKPISKP